MMEGFGRENNGVKFEAFGREYNGAKFEGLGRGGGVLRRIFSDCVHRAVIFTLRTNAVLVFFLGKSNCASSKIASSGSPKLFPVCTGVCWYGYSDFYFVKYFFFSSFFQLILLGVFFLA